MADTIAPEVDSGIIQEAIASLDRRRMMRRASLGVGAAAIAAAGLLGSSGTANATNQGAGPADTDILNFALNLEYLEAEYYIYATTGQGLSSSLRTGPVGTQGQVGIGLQVPFQTAMVQQYAARVAVDESNHVTLLRAALGNLAVAEPYIDVGVSPTSAFSVLAAAAGIPPNGPNGIFNPYANDLSFLLGAAIFEDVGVTAYVGAARFIGNPNYVEVAAGILAVEAYHAGAIRAMIAAMGASQTFGQISALRGTLSSAGGNGSGEQPIILSSAENFNLLAADNNSLAFRRTTRQVLNIVYGAAGASKGLFFPNGMNGNITT